jgi:SAM-dependent methyltransferase
VQQFHVKRPLGASIRLDNGRSAMRLLNDNLLERSGVVANSRMNRDRTLTGSNGYAKELGFNPVSLLREKGTSSSCAKWLDLCCGSGKALIEAGKIVQDEGLDTKYEIVGVDLVGSLLPASSNPACLGLIKASLINWQPDRSFDVITCVHGLHYIGDKLGLISRAVSWLTDDGYFAANIDLTNIKYEGGHSASRMVSIELRRNGLEYDPRKKLVTCLGRRIVNCSLRYLGGDDQAGPNYTGQPVVDSYYGRSGPTG